MESLVSKGIFRHITKTMVYILMFNVGGRVAIYEENINKDEPVMKIGVYKRNSYQPKTSK